MGYGAHSGGKHSNTHSNSNATQHACASLCDEIVVLWRLAALNPGLAPDERDMLHAQFTSWHLKILDRVTKCMVTSTSHNSRQQQNMRNDTELFTGFKPAIEACYLDWEDYPIAGITHTQDTNPMYHCPFTCFKSDSKTEGMTPGQVNCSQAILTNNVKQFHPQAHHTAAKQNNRRRCYASSSNNSNSSNDSVSQMVLNTVERTKRDDCDFGNRSSVSSEGFCENEDEIGESPILESSHVHLKPEQPKEGSSKKPETNNKPEQDSALVVNTKIQTKTDPGPSMSNAKQTITTTDISSPSSSTSLSSASSSIISQKQIDYYADDQQPSTSQAALKSQTSRRSSKDDSSTDSQVEKSEEPRSQSQSQIPEQQQPCKHMIQSSQFQEQSNQYHQQSQMGQSQDPKIPMFSNLRPTEDAWDILFARAEGLHAHGHGREACILGVRLAEQMLANPPNLMIEIPPPPKRKGKKHVNPISHQVSVLASGTLAKCAFLCQVLAENSEHYHIGFRVCLFGLEMPRPPASTKPLEVKLANQESDLLGLLKKIPLGPMELKVIRERAEHLRDGTLKSRGEALLPIMLASFIFDALVMPSVSGKENRMKVMNMYRFPTDENLGFEAAVTALGLKANVSEAEHPLLCEGTRRQRGDLALTLLSYYKDEPRKICRIMEKLLDREIHTLIKNPLLPSYYSNNPPTRSQSSQMRIDELEMHNHNELLNDFAGSSRPQSSTSAELESGMSAMNLSIHNSQNNLQPAASNTPPQMISGMGSLVTRSKDSRYKGKRAYPSIPNQPSEASAHFMFELAKNVLTKAGGTSSTSLFTQATTNNNHHGPHRALHMCAFQLGLYALGLHNCVSPNWLSRTYSSHVSWIIGQAMEIGAPAISFLIDTWEGHLTPPEAAGMADRASSRGWDSNMVYPAAELALSVLPHAAALNPNEIQRAILQCKEQSDQMLERACLTVEKAAKGGGVYPEVLFQVAKYWYELYLRNTPGGELEPEEQHDYFNVNLMTLDELPPPAAAPTQPQPNQPGPYPPGPSMPAMVPGMPPFTPYTYPCQGIYHQNIPYHANQMQMYIPSPQFSYPPPPGPSNQTAPYPQPVPPFQAMPPPQPYNPINSIQGQPFQGVPQNPVLVNVSQPPNSQPGMPANMQYFNPPPVQMAPPSQQPGNAMGRPGMHHGVAYPGNASNSTVFAGTQQVRQRHPHQFSPIQLRYLLSAYNIGMLALETLARRVHDDRPQAKYARNPPYGEDVKWLLRISKRLGTQYLHQFCVCAVNSIVSPFVLHEVAIESAHYLARNNSALVMQHLRSALAPLVTKCQQM